jgi:dihydroflavonol-4-reductase
MRVFVLPEEDTGSLNGISLEVVRGDVLDREAVREALRGIDTVYHLAGIISIMPGKDELMRRVNVVGTSNVASFAREAGVRRMIFVSSIHALARPPEGRGIDESVPFDPGSPAGEYDRTKAEGSLAVLAEVTRGLDAVIVCPTGIIGPYHTRGGSPMIGLLRRWMKPGGHVVVDGAFDFVDVRDVARGLILAAERGMRGETYIIRGERVSLRGLLQMVREETGHRGPNIVAPFRLALFAAALATLHSRLWKTRVGFTRYALETLVSNSVISGEKAHRVLGYEARPLRATVRDTVRWLSGNPAQRAAAFARRLQVRPPAASAAG